MNSEIITTFCDMNIEMVAGPLRAAAYEQICIMAANCYQVPPKNDIEGMSKFISNVLIRRGHLTPLECCKPMFKIVCDRAIATALTRHRVGIAFTQESTHYINYLKKQELSYIIPPSIEANQNTRFAFMEYCKGATAMYESLIKKGVPSSEARAVLPLATKTTLMMSANFRELRHIIEVRGNGITGKDQVQMERLGTHLRNILCVMYPAVFKDLEVNNEA